MSRKPRPILQDMPAHLKQRIADNLERYTDKMALRSFNAEFRQIIGNPAAHYHYFDFCCVDNKIYLYITNSYHDTVLEYKPTELGCLVKKGWYSPVHLVKDRHHAQVALQDFQSIIDNPNLTVDAFYLTAHTPQVLGILGQLIPGKLKVKDFFVRYSGLHEGLVPVLSHLDPHFLNQLDLRADENVMAPMEFGELIKLDQWKSLKSLCLCKVLSPVIPVEYLSHVLQISLEMNSSLAQLPAMINHFRGSPTFKQCRITTSLDVSEMKNAIGEDAPPVIYQDASICLLEYPATNNQSGMRIVMQSGIKLGIYKKH